MRIVRLTEETRKDLLSRLLKNPYAQAVLQGLKPCIIGIILATGVYMILRHCVGSVARLTIDATATVMTISLAAIYFGSRRVLKKGLSPIALIALSALAGVVVYGL